MNATHAGPVRFGAIPKPGDVLLIDEAASVQFQGANRILFRMIRVNTWQTYDGWIWLHGYALDWNERATEQRDIFVQLAGLKVLPRHRTRVVSRGTAQATGP